MKTKLEYILSKIDPQKGNNRSWAYLGVYYGYPECCIIAFCNRSGPPNDQQSKVSKLMGFIPCQTCTSCVSGGGKTLESLIKNRICPDPFPYRNKYPPNDRETIESIEKVSLDNYFVHLQEADLGYIEGPRRSAVVPSHRLTFIDKERYTS